MQITNVLAGVAVQDLDKAKRWHLPGCPEVELDDSTSDNVLLASLADPDGNAVTVVEVREGVTL